MGSKLKFKRITRKQPTIVDRQLLIDRYERIQNAHKNGTLDPTEVVPLTGTTKTSVKIGGQRIQRTPTINKPARKRGRPRINKQSTDIRRQEARKRRKKHSQNHFRHYRLSTDKDDELSAPVEPTSDAEGDDQQLAEIFRRWSRSFVDPITKNRVRLTPFFC